MRGYDDGGSHASGDAKSTFLTSSSSGALPGRQRQISPGCPSALTGWLGDNLGFQPGGSSTARVAPSGDQAAAWPRGSRSTRWPTALSVPLGSAISRDPPS